MAASPGCGGLSGGRESASPKQVVVDGERREVDCVGATFSAETRHEQALPCMLPPTRQQERIRYKRHVYAIKTIALS